MSRVMIGPTGKLLITENGKIALDPNCCCNIVCCACFPTTPTLYVEFTGAVTGTGLILASGIIGECWSYIGAVELTGGPCFGGLMCITPRLFLRCPEGSTDINDIDLLVQDDFACGLCHVGNPTDQVTYRKPISVSCDEPCGFIGTWRYLTSGFCDCGEGEEVFITISESVLPCP